MASIDGSWSITKEMNSLLLVLRGQIFLLGNEWDNLLDPEKKEIAQAAVETISELDRLIR